MENGTARLRTDRAEAPPVAASKIGFHVVATQDVEAIADHYEKALGLVRSGSDGDTVFLTPHGDHHSVAIRKGEPNGRAGLGFEIHGTLEQTAEGLGAAGIEAEQLRIVSVLEDVAGLAGLQAAHEEAHGPLGETGDPVGAGAEKAETG